MDKSAWNKSGSPCLRITGKVAFNNMSNASQVYILGGQKLIKNARNGQFRDIFKIWSLLSKQCYRQIIFDRTKMVGKCQKKSNTLGNNELFSLGAYISMNEAYNILNGSRAHFGLVKVNMYRCTGKHTMTILMPYHFGKLMNCAKSWHICFPGGEHSIQT